jgi:hypothetical protein
MRYRTLTKPVMAPIRLTTGLANRTTRRSRAARRESARSAADGARVGDASGAPAPTGAQEPKAPETLVATVGPVHRDAARLAAWIGAGAPLQSDPRQVHRAGDVAVAAMCRHLATMERVVYPDVLAVLPGADGAVARLRLGARQMQVVMRGVEQIVQGDTHASGTAAAQVRGEFAAAISQHGRIEEDLLREYDQTAAAWRRERLAAEYERMLPHAQSRPHPYLFGRGPFAGRLGSRLLGRWDGVLDTMDAREVPWAPVREPGEVGLWGAWLLGRPPQTGGRPGKTATTPAGRAGHR